MPRSAESGGLKEPKISTFATIILDINPFDHTFLRHPASQLQCGVRGTLGLSRLASYGLIHPRTALMSIPRRFQTSWRGQYIIYTSASQYPAIRHIHTLPRRIHTPHDTNDTTRARRGARDEAEWCGCARACVLLCCAAEPRSQSTHGGVSRLFRLLACQTPTAR